jgi:hypothetical protein
MAHGVIDVMKDVVNILLVFLLFNGNASSFLKDKKLKQSSHERVSWESLTASFSGNMKPTCGQFNGLCGQERCFREIETADPAFYLRATCYPRL